MSSNTKKETIETIRKLYKTRTKTREQLETMFASFAEENPHIFRMICSPNCDDKILSQILNAHDSVKKGEQSQHDASVSVGKILVDNYVIPELKNKK